MTRRMEDGLRKLINAIKEELNLAKFANIQEKLAQASFGTGPSRNSPRPNRCFSVGTLLIDQCETAMGNMRCVRAQKEVAGHGGEGSVDDLQMRQGRVGPATVSRLPCGSLGLAEPVEDGRQCRWAWNVWAYMSRGCERKGERGMGGRK